MTTIKPESKAVFPVNHNALDVEKQLKHFVD